MKDKMIHSKLAEELLDVNIYRNDSYYAVPCNYDANSF